MKRKGPPPWHGLHYGHCEWLIALPLEPEQPNAATSLKVCTVKSTGPLARAARLADWLAGWLAGSYLTRAALLGASLAPFLFLTPWSLFPMSRAVFPCSPAENTQRPNWSLWSSPLSTAAFLFLCLPTPYCPDSSCRRASQNAKRMSCCGLSVVHFSVRVSPAASQRRSIQETRGGEPPS